MKQSAAHVAEVADAPIDLEAAKDLVQSPIIPEVVEPLLEAARAELGALAPGWGGAGPHVLDDLLGHYRQTLARLTNLVLIQRFASFHLVGNPLWRPRAGRPGFATEARPRTMLDAYIQWEEIERVLAPDGPYPELAALLAKARRNWLRSSEELLARVRQHRPDIAGIMDVGVDRLGELTGLRFGVSDPHNDGRTVAILDFDGRRIVYKPRPLEAEEGWNAVFGRVAGAVGDGAVFLPRVAGFSDYGFMEFVPDAECADEAAVKRCYFRYGVLTAVAHALGACDLHHENVIVTGEHPVVIDAEPLFRGRLATSERGDSRLRIEQNLSLADLDVRESVLELGLLPMVMQVPSEYERDGETQRMREVEIGALCAYASRPLTEVLPCALGTDDIQMRPHQVAARTFPNLPRCRGEARFPRDYVDDIVSGFLAAHEYVSRNKDTFTGAGGLIDGLADCRIRMLARPTMDYMNVLSRSLTPQVLRSSEARRSQVTADLKEVGKFRMDTVAALVPPEIESIMNGDVPFFSMKSNGVSCAGARLYASPAESARARLNAMDAFDRVMQAAQTREQLVRRDDAIVESRPASWERDAVERHAMDVVQGLADAAIDFEGAPCWVYASYAAGYSTTMAHMDREALYEGAAGTALVVAEAGRRGGREEWVDLAVRVFDAVVKDPEPRSVGRGGGLARGLGGLVYALVRVARASGREALLDAAHRLVLGHGMRLAETDELDEVLYGRAGFLLSLLALHRTWPAAGLLPVIERAASVLMRRAIVSDEGAQWPAPGGRQMPNVSHGAAGIAMALARWSALSGDARAATLAQEALRHDDAFWIEKERGWADGRFLDVDIPERTNWSWCNGRSGALLARLAVAEALRTPFASELAEQALGAAASDVLTEAGPGLCCGTAGAVDALLTVRERQPHVVLERHLKHAMELLATRSPKSHYLMLTGSLFAGTAGLAFSLLRAASPSEVDSVLWLA